MTKYNSILFKKRHHLSQNGTEKINLFLKSYMKILKSFLQKNLKKFTFSFKLKLSLFLYLFFVLFLHFAKHGIQVQTATFGNFLNLTAGIISISLLTIALDHLIQKKVQKKDCLFSTLLGLSFLWVLPLPNGNVFRY